MSSLQAWCASALRRALLQRLGAYLAVACWLCWLGSGQAQASVQRVKLAEGVLLAVPAALQEAVAPAAPALPGQVERFFTDGSLPPLLLWVQSVPTQRPAGVPPSREALEQLARGFSEGSSGVHGLQVGPYDPQRGALGFQFQSGAVGSPATSFAGVAFVTRAATVLALLAAPSERAPDVRAAVELLWQQSRVSAAALAPSAPEAAFAWGRLVGIVIGSLLGGLALTCALSWLLSKANVARPSARAISGFALVGCAALIVMLHGSIEAVLQLLCYVLVASVCYVRPPRWLVPSNSKSWLRDERGLSTIEYVILLVLVAAVAIGAWHAFGDSVRSKLAGADARFSDAVNTGQDVSDPFSGASPRSNSSGLPSSGSSASVNASSGTRSPGSSGSPAGASPGATRPGASGASRSLAGGAPSGASSNGTAASGTAARGTAASPTAPSAPASVPSAAAPAAPAAPAPSAPAVAVTVPPPSPPGFFQRAKDFVRESAPVQTAIGIGFGTLQSLPIGGFLVPSPAPRSRAFEVGRGIGQLATGVTQFITGTGMMGGGGAAAVAGGVGALPSGGTSLVVSAGGLAVATEGVVVAGVGATNAAAGLDTLTHAMSMSGPPSSGSPPPGSTPAPAAGATPPTKPPPGAATAKGVEITDAKGNPLGEFDGVQKGKFIEDKSARGLGTLNPRTGRPVQTADEWAKKQIFDKTEVRIDNLLNKATATRPTTGGSTTVPGLQEIKSIRQLEFHIESATPEVRAAVEQQLTALRAQHPDWTFTATFGP